MPAVGLTDHGTVAGIIDFIQQCRKENIKPIVGSEMYLSRDHTCHSKKGQPELRKGNRHINIIAKNYKGYKNLCCLSQISSLEGTYYDPRIDLELLEKYSEGLIVTSACLSNVINWHLSEDRYDKAKLMASYLKDIFQDDFYLEVMYHGIEKESKVLPYIQKLGKELSITVLATNDCHYSTRADAEAHDVVLCMSSQTYVNAPKRLKFPYPEFYFKSTQEMKKIFGHVPSFMKNTLEVAEKCDYSDLVFTSEGGQMKLPKFNLPNEETDPYKYLYGLAINGLKKLGLNNSKEHIDRLKLELSDIKLIYDTKGYDFSTYFLIVYDMYDWAKRQKIPCGIRGSGYGSLLLYCLGLSEVDPIKFDLYWERFLGFDMSLFVVPSDFGMKKKL